MDIKLIEPGNVAGIRIGDFLFGGWFACRAYCDVHHVQIYEPDSAGTKRNPLPPNVCNGHSICVHYIKSTVFYDSVQR